ncbi:MAG: hypothetical protein AAB518_01765 [Patescibacteria group bacterium]|mgnify:CR=1 FL=1
MKQYSVRHIRFVRGDSMIEMLVAISIVAVSLVGILSLVGRSFALNRLTTEQYVATYLAAEGMELVKNLFDHSYLLEVQNVGGVSNRFYGWTGAGSIAPSGSYGLYYLDYSDTTLISVPGGCAITLPPTEATVANLFQTCGSAQLPYLNFAPPPAGAGYQYTSGTPTKFRRVIIIDEPTEGNPDDPTLPTIDYRITSAVGWESRGGEFVVQLQDHFLPWRIP